MYDYFEAVINLNKFKPFTKIDNITLGDKKLDKQFGIIRKLAYHPRYKIDAFGFIMDTEGIDRFFHWSEMSKSSSKPFHHLEVGDKVSFLPNEEEIDGEFKKQAIEVEYIHRSNNGKRL